ncbi:DUF6879 family protein [Micromonospora sp. WMMD998]|uniref:DUF6879 family protein n=1 Tax=Micromonospora sp. WMMD998 TaxID=3016092 RepID=UPI00249A9878|nr:DUF6879 family protein [Micromonospora sp. WMMD998]WFE38634.1 hypothetical protein O7619_09420 [Micromonospora sp. WMMD998]
MRDLLRAASARRLSLPEYEADFYATVETVDGVILKTERLQTFREPGSPSWEAFAAGRWDEALRIAAQPNPELAQFFARLDEMGSGLHRLRIVELPLTPYLIWELNFLRFRAEAGERIGVLDAEAVSDLEADHGRVPELMVAGSRAVYDVRYDDAGTPVGAEKIVEPEIVEGCRAQVLALLDRAEPIESFFHREVDGRTPSTAEL